MKARRLKNGVVQDKLWLPGLMKLKRLIDGGFFGRILSVRIEFGYWVFEGDWQPAQRPSWNYRKEDGGGIIVDMFAPLAVHPRKPLRQGEVGGLPRRDAHPGTRCDEQEAVRRDRGRRRPTRPLSGRRR